MSDTNLDYESDFCVPERASTLPNKLLVGAGPTNCSPRVILALTQSTVGANSPELYQIMDDVQAMLRYTFQTKNEVTLALQTSGTGGIEAALCNVVEPGDKVIVAVSGYWGQRVVEKAKSRNADVIRLESMPCETFSLDELENALSTHRPVALFVTHGESSGGTLQELEGLGRICHKYNCLLVVDAVVSLAGVPFFTDRWEIDIVVTGTQKAIGAPAGFALITMSPRAVERMRHLKSRPPFYYDIVEICRQWNILHDKRFYYITYNSHLLSSLREALLEIVEEGLINRWKRHRECAERFWKGIDKIGMKILVEKVEKRLPMVNCYFPPAGVTNYDIANFLSDKYIVEPGVGITSYSTNALRIGFMGYNARLQVVDYVLRVLEEAIEHCRESKNSLVK